MMKKIIYCNYNLMKLSEFKLKPWHRLCKPGQVPYNICNTASVHAYVSCCHEKCELLPALRCHPLSGVTCSPVSQGIQSYFQITYSM